MESKSRLLQKITNLQSDVQYLISKTKNKELPTEDRNKCVNEKTKKTNELKMLIKQSRETQKTPQTPKSEVPKVRKVKAEREKLKEEFMDYVKKEKEYFEKDSKKLPGIVFLHNSILSEYGLCPYIDATSFSCDDIYQKRLNWLNEQKDKGELYYELNKQLFSEEETDKLCAEKTSLEDKLDDMIQLLLSESQRQLYTETLDAFVAYISCKIKTKIMKEKYKNIVHSLSILKKECGLSINEYWGCKYNTCIQTNELMSDTQLKHDLYITDMFHKHVEDYKDMIDSIQIKQKFKENNIKSLKNELYLYLTKQKVFGNLRATVQAQQAGKYFRRWVLLSKEEIDERFFSFAVYYIEKNEPNVTLEKKNILVDNLSKLLQDSYRSKEMIYRDLKWNTTKGMIENIKTLSYDKESSKFMLKSSKSHLSIKTTKSLSKRTIITKENEKIINEEMLYYIVEMMKHAELTSLTAEDCTNMFEKIKAKLRVKKINSNDKGIIETKFNEMFNLIKQNNCSNTD